jgi:hypothetical protein
VALESIKSTRAILFELTTFLGVESNGDGIFILGDELERLSQALQPHPVPGASSAKIGAFHLLRKPS